MSVIDLTCSVPSGPESQELSEIGPDFALKVEPMTGFEPAKFIKVRNGHNFAQFHRYAAKNKAKKSINVYKAKAQADVRIL